MNSGIESSVSRNWHGEEKINGLFFKVRALLAEVMILGLHLIPSINFYPTILVRE